MDFQLLNPWTSMWTKPRATIQQIIDTDPRRMVLLLAAVGGVANVLAGFVDPTSPESLGNDMAWPMMVLIALPGGAICGVIGVYLGSALVRWTGKWIGGQGPLQNIRAAIAWSNVPVIWGLLLWIPAIALFGQDLFTPATQETDPMFLTFAPAQMIIGLWGFVVLLKSLGQVQGFSPWRALANLVLAGLVLRVVALLGVVVIAGVAGLAG